MANDTLINGRSPVTKASNGTVLAFPDACKTPTAAGPIPIPYPNIGQSSALGSGTTKVSVNGVEAATKGSYFEPTSGDEAGSAGGVASSKIKGKAEPLMYSFDVMFEGKGVVRNFDPFTGNNKNTPPIPIIQAQVVMAPMLTDNDDKEEPEKCEYCKKNVHRFADKPGNHIGSSGALASRIFAGGDKLDHPWHTGGLSLQAHHVICSESMQSDVWAQLCRDFGYDINRKENGVMLPWSMQLACQISSPLHRGNHALGKADGLPYPDKIKELIAKVQEKAAAGGYCSARDQLVKDLDAIAVRVLGKVSSFTYTITSDGADYATGKRGCGGVPGLGDVKAATCPKDRSHQLVQGKTKSLIAKRTGALQIGK